MDYNLLSQIYEHTKNNSKMLSSIMTSLNEISQRLKIKKSRKKMEDIFEKKALVSRKVLGRKSKKLNF